MVIGGGVPNPASGGGALTTYTIVRWLLTAGHRVTVFVLHDPVYYDPAGAQMTSRIDHLHSLGAEVVPLPSRASAEVLDAARDLPSRVRRNLVPRLTELLPHAADAPALAAAVAATDCDVAFVYHVEALAASREVRIPRVAGLGDPPHLPPYYRWRASVPSLGAARLAARVALLGRTLPRFTARLLEECAGYGAFAAHHAAWFRSHGAPRCEYYRTPVPEPLSDGVWGGRGNGPIRLLLLGHLGSVVTIDGLRVFARALPLLERSLGSDGFWVDVVGGYEPPHDLAKLFEHPRVRRHPHSEGAAEWLRESDALLVPTSIPLGIRVRIISAFAAGTPVVAHRANALGTPELADDMNSLLGGSPDELVEKVVRLAREPGLAERIGRGGRSTYERFFSPNVAARAIEDRLESARTGAHVR